MRNRIIDVPGVKVGNAHDARAATGVTVAVFDSSCVASVATLGGAPGDRAVTLLESEMTHGVIDSVVLSGGSLSGLDAAADCLARGVYEATALPYATSLPDYRRRFTR